MTLERSADAIRQSVSIWSRTDLCDLRKDGWCHLTVCVGASLRLCHLRCIITKQTETFRINFRFFACLFVCFPQGLLKTPPVFLVSGESWTLVVMCNIFNQESSCCCIYLKLQASWHTLVTPAPERWRQEDHKFKIILSHIGSSRPAWATWALVSKTTIKG